MNRIREKWVVLLATGCYAGYIPQAPGTAGSIVAIPFCYLVSRLGPIQASLFVFLFMGIGVWVSGEAERLFNQRDSSRIVIDEIVGMCVTLFLVPWNAASVVIGLLLFRIMDITKPFPIRRLETELSGGWGVVGDDVVAGIYANITLRVFLWVL